MRSKILQHFFITNVISSCTFTEMDNLIKVFTNIDNHLNRLNRGTYNTLGERVRYYRIDEGLQNFKTSDIAFVEPCFGDFFPRDVAMV